MNSYIDKTPIAGFEEKLILYKRDDVATDNWYYRAKIDGVKDYIRRSTKTSNLDLAKAEAVKQYTELLGKKAANVSLNVIRVRNAAEKWLKEMDEQELKQKTRRTYIRNTWYRYMDGYFGDKPIANITDEFVDGYWQYRLSYYTTGAGKERKNANTKRLNAKSRTSHNIKVNPSYATLKAEASIINEFFRWAARDKNKYLLKILKISAKDVTSKEEQVLGVRPTFSSAEWNVLTKNLYNYAESRGRWASNRVNAWHRQHRKMFRAFVLFLSSTGLRVGEAKQIRWSDIRKSFDSELEKDILQVHVRAAISKVRRQRTAIAHSELIIQVLDEWRELTEFADNDDLIFYNKAKDGSPKVVDFSTTFRDFLVKVPYLKRDKGLLENAEGAKRTLYSLRHFYATKRIEQGVEIYTLAKVMGTAVRNIEYHYGHVADDKLAREASKNKLSKKESEQVRDLKDAALMIRLLRQGDVSSTDVLKKLNEIAEQTKL